jgi:anti-sigma B factor antagonist
MKIEERRIGQSVFLEVLEPRLGADGAASFKESVGQYLQAGQRRLVLDLSHVGFIDSSGLGAILSVLKRMGDNGNLILCGVTEPVACMLKLTRMDRVLTICKTVEDAVAV